MTEKEMLTGIAHRLGLLLDCPKDSEKDDSISIHAYYEIGIEFDEKGNVISFNTHP